jgi:chromosome segregation ATPase
VERAMAGLKTQKEHLETELLSLRSALEEAEDAQFDAQESSKKQRKQAAFHVLHLVMRATRKIAEEAQASVDCRTAMETNVSRLQVELSDEKSRWEKLMTRIQEAWTQVQAQHGEMTQTLTQYKRDELVAHRSSSSVLSNEISIVTKQLEEVDEMKTCLERDVESLQTDAKTIENSLRDLMRQSSDSSGALNMAVVAKKRRLNEEFEVLLERIEKKQAEIRTVDQTLASLRARREEKEQEMRHGAQTGRNLGAAAEANVAAGLRCT